MGFAGAHIRAKFVVNRVPRPLTRMRLARMRRVLKFIGEHAQIRYLVFGAPAKTEQKEYTMSRRCELSGKGVLTGNNVSHAKNRSRRRYLPNLQKVTLMSESLGRSFNFRIAASTLRTVDHRGGLDAYLAKAKDAELSPNALKVKKDIAAAAAA